jgi:hypothetical protein
MEYGSQPKRTLVCMMPYHHKLLFVVGRRGRGEKKRKKRKKKVLWDVASPAQLGNGAASQG